MHPARAHRLFPAAARCAASLDRVLMHTVAEFTARSMVTSLAVSLEGTSAVAGQMPAAWQPKTRPQVAPG